MFTVYNLSSRKDVVEQVGIQGKRRQAKTHHRSIRRGPQSPGQKATSVFHHQDSSVGSWVPLSPHSRMKGAMVGASWCAGELHLGAHIKRSFLSKLETFERD